MQIELGFKKDETTETKENVRFHKSSCLIGRNVEDLKLEDKKCSRVHAMLFETSEGVLAIKHLGRTNGTYVNDKLITLKQLTVGDKIQIGETVLYVLRYSASPTKAPQTRPENEKPVLCLL